MSSVPAKRASFVLAAMLSLSAPAGCAQNVGRAAVSLSVRLSQRSPGDASVFIDEEYVGPLGYVAAHGVRLPVGEHRVTVQKDGFFPYDRRIVADRDALALDVDLTPIPD